MATSGSRRLLIVTADDYGLTPGVSRAVLEAHHRGVVTATSVLALAPAAIKSIGWLSSAPRLSVGVHLAAVGEDPPLLLRSEIPTLVDRRGRLAPSWRALLPRLAARRVDPADLQREFRAQIDLVAGMGVPVSALDTHQHVHLWPTVGAVVRDLALERGITYVRCPRSASAGPRGSVLRALAGRRAAHLVRAGLATSDRFAGLDEAGGWDRDRLIAVIGRLGPMTATCAEINTHPCAASDPDRARYRWDYGWPCELSALCDPEVRAAVSAAGFRLATPADLRPPDARRAD